MDTTNQETPKPAFPLLRQWEKVMADIQQQNHQLKAPPTTTTTTSHRPQQLQKPRNVAVTEPNVSASPPKLPVTSKPPPPISTTTSVSSIRQKIAEQLHISPIPTPTSPSTDNSNKPLPAVPPRRQGLVLKTPRTPPPVPAPNVPLEIKQQHQQQIHESVSPSTATIRSLRIPQDQNRARSRSAMNLTPNGDDLSALAGLNFAEISLEDDVEQHHFAEAPKQQQYDSPSPISPSSTTDNNHSHNKNTTITTKPAADDESSDDEDWILINESKHARESIKEFVSEVVEDAMSNNDDEEETRQEETAETATDVLSEYQDQNEEEDGDSQEDEEEYNAKMLERLQKHRTMAKLADYHDILSEDEQTSIKRASVSTGRQIEKDIAMVLGESNTWSSESEEVVVFRKNMAAMRSGNQIAPSIDKHSLLPPAYLTVDPAASSHTKELICRIYLPQGNQFKTLTCPPLTTADQFLDKFIQKMKSDTKEDLTDQILFKASGYSDYIYGETPMIQFDHVWNCVKKGERVILTVVDWEHIWSEVDPHDFSLKNFTYDTSKVDIGYSKLNRTKVAWEVNETFRFKLCRIDNLPLEESVNSELYVVSQLLMGNQSIADQHFSTVVDCSDKTVIWGQYINFPEILISEIPREATLRLICYSRSTKSSYQVISSVGSKDVVVANITVPVYEYDGTFKSGLSQYNTWLELKPYTNTQNHDIATNPPLLSVEFETRDVPIVFPDDETKIPPEMAERWIKFEQKRMSKYSKISHSSLLKEYERIINTDPLYQMNEEEGYRIWSVRASAQLLTSNPRALFKFMQSVPWQHPQAVFIAHQMLDKWAQIEPIDALELLNYNFADGKLRRHAIKVLSKLSDVELKELLLQLVQTLKFELYHDSSLARFLIERSLRSTHMIGHVMFWHLKSEMHDPCIRERFGLILEEYLRNCGSHRRELLKQNGIVEQLLDIAMLIKRTKKHDQLTVLRDALERLRLPPKFKLPLSTRIDAKGIIIEKCKVMNSKKLPLWLVFENSDKTGEPIYVIFKAGDDLRQDLLTLQILRNMDLLWKTNSLNLRLNPYGCVCLGDMIGMIEVVTNSDTIANITHERGGASAAFSQDPLTVWLQKHNNSSKEVWDRCVENFVKSCAGYCCATYVLGIGDRHNDNIMLTKKGDLFHIDFGHFLGNFKQFKGIYKRETTPFVFTPMYAHVMGGKDAEAYNEFVKLGCEAFLILRKQHKMLMNLFLLMLAAGIPELTSIQDIMWLRKVLVLELSDKKAVKHYMKQIKKSLKNTRARINDAVHIYAKK
jgi:DNA-binding protein H-NS